MPSDLTYSEPTVLWRLWSLEGAQAHATIIPGVPYNTLTWFVGEEMVRAENYAEWDVALVRAEEVRREMMDAGWMDEE